MSELNPLGRMGRGLNRDFTIHELTAQFAAYDKHAAEPDRTPEVAGAQPLDFPSKLKPLWIPKRYKIVKGGRGGAKSWGVARALLIMGCNRTLRICCFREVQKNIKESVHQLLKDQIEAMDLGDFYEALENEIRGSNGTLIIFAGLSALTATSIKSFEGQDIAWVEEAQTVRKRSWELLIPTIRKKGSEIWITMNPELETDPTYVLFVDEPPEGMSIVLTMNYRDNPWFPDILELERSRAKRRRLASSGPAPAIRNSAATFSAATRCAAPKKNGNPFTASSAPAVPITGVRCGSKMGRGVSVGTSTPLEITENNSGLSFVRRCNSERTASLTAMM